MTKINLHKSLLVNTLKHFRGKKWHSQELYDNLFYTQECLESNPFAQALLSTKEDGSRARFPRGNMVELTVGPIPEDKVNHYVATKGKRNKVKSFWLVPILQPLSKKLYNYTSGYMILNQRYISSIMGAKGLANRFIPRKFFHLNLDLIENVEIVPNFEKILSKQLEDDIIQGLKSSTSEEDPDTNGLRLKTTGEIFQFVDKTPVININKLIPGQFNQEMFISFKTNPQLCQSIIKMVNYKF